MSLFSSPLISGSGFGPAAAAAGADEPKEPTLVATSEEPWLT